MPCSGPDLEAARREGNAVAQSMLAKMIGQNGMWNVSETQYDSVFMLQDARVRWQEAKTRFIRAVEDLFVEDAANSF